MRIVHLPAQQESLVMHAHEELGHFGVRHIHSLLEGQYWWWGMHIDVQNFVARCMVCDRMCASFNAPSPELHPLRLPLES